MRWGFPNSPPLQQHSVFSVMWLRNLIVWCFINQFEKSCANQKEISSHDRIHKKKLLVTCQWNKWNDWFKLKAEIDCLLFSDFDWELIFDIIKFMKLPTKRSLWWIQLLKHEAPLISLFLAIEVKQKSDIVSRFSWLCFESIEEKKHYKSLDFWWDGVFLTAPPPTHTHTHQHPHPTHRIQQNVLK